MTNLAEELSFIPDEEIKAPAPVVQAPIVQEQAEIGSIESELSFIPDEPKLQAKIEPTDILKEQFKKHPFKVEIPTDENLAAKAIKSSESSAIMTGSLIGGAVGAASPVPGGMAIGGALGSAMGEFAYQTYEDLARMGGVEGLGAAPTFEERLKRGGGEAITDFGFTVGTKAAFDLIGAGAKALLRPESREMIKEAERLGIEPYRLTYSNSKVIQWYSRILARFPFAAGKMRTRANELGPQFEKVKDTLFMQMGPSWDMAKLGVRLDDAISTKYKWFRRELNRDYAKALKLARDTGATVSTEGIVDTAREAIIQRRLAYSAQGMNDDEIIKALKSDEVVKRLLKYSKLKPRVSVDELRATDELLNDDLAWASNEGGSRISQMGKIKDKFQASKNTIDNVEVRDLLNKADKKFATTMSELFENPTAQKSQRVVEKGRFQVGKIKRQGTRNPDESFQVLWNAKSPQAMKDLSNLVGKERFGASVRTFLEKEWERAAQAGFEEWQNQGILEKAMHRSLGFDFPGFRRALGIGKPATAEYQAMQTALQESGSGVTMKDLASLLGLMETAMRNSPDDVNAFIARRAVLGGHKAIAGLFGSTFGVGTLLGSRVLGRILSSKPLYKQLEIALDPNVDAQVKRAAVLTLEKILSPDRQTSRGTRPKREQ